MNDITGKKKSLFLLTLLGLALLAFLIWGWPEEPEVDHFPAPEKMTSEILGREEGCMNCHAAVEGFAPAHDPQNIGCSPCHRGDPRALEADLAHTGMILVPGNLETVYQTCGTANCHYDIAQRVDKSLMTTMAGIISVDRFAFGEQDSLDGDFHIQHLGFSPADSHLRHLCASCHLGNEKKHPGPVMQSTRGGGCNACHLNYSTAALAGLAQFEEKATVPTVHPALNLKVTNDHCFGCHSRSSRISLNYEGWHETQLTAADIAGKTGFRVLEDKRVMRYVASDVHHQAGLECIDCHKVAELMGDGNLYQHKEAAQKTFCEDCHFSGTPAMVSYDSLGLEHKKILALRGRDGQDQSFVRGQRSKLPLINVLLDEEGLPFMLGKNSGKEHPLKPPAHICTQGRAHDDLSCSSCHTGWAPQCVGCHQEYDPTTPGFDLLARERTTGKWVEYLGEFFSELPSLGIVEMGEEDEEKIREIKTFIPGMIMTVDQQKYPGMQDQPERFHRLFAPTAAHTTVREGRSCQSCHNDPVALGYGRGQLTFDPKTRRWRFAPEYVASPQDGLPQDAWIGFLREPSGVNTTRPYARPFRLAEQRRILEVGACLTCHQDRSKVMQQALEDFDEVKAGMMEWCLVPVWER